VPRRRGGTDDWSNLRPLCHRCHSRKTVLNDGGFGRPREPKR
jgi:5-methylcytosine-specific restriction endonuclease McrA